MYGNKRKSQTVTREYNLCVNVFEMMFLQKNVTYLNIYVYWDLEVTVRCYYRENKRENKASHIFYYLKAFQHILRLPLETLAGCLFSQSGIHSDSACMFEVTQPGLHVVSIL